MKRKSYMLDTSVIIDDPYNIIRFNDNGSNDVFVNNVVYGELNNLKKNKDGDVGFNARSFFRGLDQLNVKILDKKDLPKSIKKISKKYNDSIVKLNFTSEGESCELFLITREEFASKDKHSANMGKEINDTFISEIALDYDLKLITSDAGLSLFHKISGGDSEFILNDSVENPLDMKFLIEVRTPPKSLEKDENGNIKKLDELLEFIEKDKETYSNFTQFKLIETAEQDGTVYDSGRVEFAMKVNGKIEIIDVSNNDEGVMKNAIIKPKSKEQALYYAALVNKHNKITAVSGSTGSGKTLIALAAGIELFKRGDIDGIIFTRNTVTANDSAAELGFRKGGEDTKVGFFMMPLYTSINVIIEEMKKHDSNISTHARYSGDTNKMTKENATEQFMRDYNIEVVDIAHLRGVTIKRKLVILDEGQNLSHGGLKLIGTRSGEDTIFVITGDVGQIDHPFLSPHRNALTKMLNLAQKDDMVAGIKLHKTVRSEIAEWFDKAL